MQRIVGRLSYYHPKRLAYLTVDLGDGKFVRYLLGMGDPAPIDPVEIDAAYTRFTTTGRNQGDVLDLVGQPTAIGMQPIFMFQLDCVLDDCSAYPLP